MTKTLKHRILEYFKDQQWHSYCEILKAMNLAGSWNQRKNEMQRERQIYWEERIVDKVWEYRLLTDPNDIDFEGCCLKKREVEQVTLNF